VRLGTFFSKAVTCGVGDDLAMLEQVRNHWSAVVGEPVAARVSPYGIRRDVLLVRAATAAWKNEITFMQEDVIAKLAQLLGQGVIDKLKVTTRLPATPARGRGQDEPAPWLSRAPRAEDLARVSKSAKVIADGELRRVFSRAMELGLRAERHRDGES